MARRSLASDIASIFAGNYPFVLEPFPVLPCQRMFPYFSTLHVFGHLSGRNANHVTALKPRTRVWSCEAGLKSVSLYNKVITAFVNEGEWQKALWLLQDMPEREVPWF